MKQQYYYFLLKVHIEQKYYIIVVLVVIIVTRKRIESMRGAMMYKSAYHCPDRQLMIYNQHTIVLTDNSGSFAGLAVIVACILTVSQLFFVTLRKPHQHSLKERIDIQFFFLRRVT